MACSSTKIHAPYHFVPLSSWVYQPAWHNEVTQDIPFKDGICGTLDITVTAYSSILVGEKDKQNKVYPYRLPNNGKYALPGSSLRGMIRNVIEIASFGKMRIVDDKRYGIRDLYASFYQSPLKNVKAGFLNYTAQGWRITPCQFTRVKHQLLSRATRRKQWGKMDVEEKYNTALQFFNQSLRVQFSKDGNEEKAEVNNIRQGNLGFFVFTGQMQKKINEFIFFDRDENKSIIVSDKVKQDFSHIYKDSDHLITLQNLEKDGKLPYGVPVFYLCDNNNHTSSFGLSLMYRLPYSNSIGDVIDHTSPNHRANNHPDLAELMFGTLDETDGKQSLKGRVSFSAATYTEESQDIQAPPYQTILSSPKPTYFPSYLKQNQQQGKLKAGDYQTYMNDTAEIRGWKRYPVKPESVPPLDANLRDKTNVQVNLNPIRANHDKPVHFTGKVRFHNLKPAELGALIWAITWDNKPSLRHSIGMGKPFGFGQVGIQINQSELIPNDLSATISLDDCLKHFKDEMEQSYPNPSGWQLSEAILNLQAMANPEKATGKTLEHMKLECFAHAKHKDRKWVLNDYIDYTSEKKAIEKTQREIAKAEEIIRQKEQEAEQRAHQQQREAAAKTAYLNQFDNPETAEMLHGIKTNLKRYTQEGGPVAVKLKKQTTPVLKANMKQIQNLKPFETQKLIELLEMALNVKSLDGKGLYNKKQRTTIKQFLNKHKQ